MQHSMIRLLILMLATTAWPACDSNDGTSDDPGGQETKTYRVRYIVDGDVGIADQILYLDTAADTVKATRAAVPFREDLTLETGQKALLRVDATPFNPFQPLPNHEATVIATILVDDVLVVSDTMRGVRRDPLHLDISFVLPE